MIDKPDLKTFYEQDGKRPRVEDAMLAEEYRYQCFLREVKSVEKRLGYNRLNIIDAGAGSGGLSVSLAMAGYSVTSIDIADTQLSKFKDISRKLGIRQIVSELEAIPLADNIADIVVCSEVLEHIERPQNVLLEFARITKPEGFLIISVPYAEILQRVLCPYCHREFSPHGHLHSFDEQTLKAILLEAGYKSLHSRVVSKLLTANLLWRRKISPAIAKILDMLQPSIKGRGWLIMVAKNSKILSS